MWGARRKKTVLVLLVGLILCGILRSAIATRLDSFDIDEAYHITAGVTYVRLGDYRLNPEHPPLIKLWVGAFLTPSVFKTPQLRPLAEKWDERHFTETVVFTENDPDAAQRRVRLAMFILNGILLLGFALAVWRAFGSEIGPMMAVGALAFLIIDPTIAAHLPVVLTDLPVALLGATAILLAWSAFRRGSKVDILLAGLALGLTLGAKHTGLIVAVAVAFLGAVMSLRKEENSPRLPRLAQVFVVLLLAWITLWGLYRFRFNESPAGLDLFNRPLAAKIADLHRPLLRNAVTLMARTHFMPRSYLWGLADILHVGVEGRVTPMFFPGPHLYAARSLLLFPHGAPGKDSARADCARADRPCACIYNPRLARQRAAAGHTSLRMPAAGHADQRHVKLCRHAPCTDCSSLRSGGRGSRARDCVGAKVPLASCR